MPASLRALAPALLWAAAVWVVGGLSRTPSVGAGLGVDKLAHLLMYGILALLLARAWLSQGWRGRAVLPVLLAAALGAADELRQRSVPGRSAEVADWVADAIGATAGTLLALRRGNGRQR